MPEREYSTGKYLRGWKTSEFSSQRGVQLDSAWAREGKKAEESHTEESQGTDVEGFAFNLAGSEDPLKIVHKSMT